MYFFTGRNYATGDYFGCIYVFIWYAHINEYHIKFDVGEEKLVPANTPFSPNVGNSLQRRAVRNMSAQLGTVYYHFVHYETHAKVHMNEARRRYIMSKQQTHTQTHTLELISWRLKVSLVINCGEPGLMTGLKESPWTTFLGVLTVRY